MILFEVRKIVFVWELLLLSSQFQMEAQIMDGVGVDAIQLLCLYNQRTI
jgi:hypothetical protein